MPQRVDRSFRKDPGRGCTQLYFLPRPAREGQASLEAGPVGRLGTINRRRKVTDEDGMIIFSNPNALYDLLIDEKVATTNYPHPVIFPERCIGCHACVDACPHDVLAIVNGIASPVARDQCMEDTACQVECPVNPKACIVVNTTKKIKPRPVPVRDPSFMTNVPGVYIIGDVSGTPLIKNAANEGADVIKDIVRELSNGAGAEPKAAVDVAIIGIGPAGLSAAIAAKQFKLRYVGIEQDKVLATIDAYPRGKYAFFKPETMDSHRAIEVNGAG